MSTIFNALQKQSSNQPGKMPRTQSNKHWQVALLVSFVIITALAATLIFVLLNPAWHFASAAPVLAAKPVSEQLPQVIGVRQEKAEEKRISRVFFHTKPLPILEDKPVPESAPENVSDEQQTALLAEQTAQQEELPAVDYSNVSNELQQRFARALLMSKDQGKGYMNSEDSDGTDLHQMASDFQKQVPAISYEFHVYSSVANDRWIRINGEDLAEGQFDSSGKIQVVEIQAQRTVFRCGSQSFTLQSLTDWQGVK